jgi:hypothetical protein
VDVRGGLPAHATETNPASKTKSNAKTQAVKAIPIPKNFVPFILYTSFFL